jgi:hypothetical protein
LIKAIIPFYLICVALYIVFSRQPDFQDGEFTIGNIHYIKNSSQKKIAAAIFSIGKTRYAINAYYPLRNFSEGQKVKIIYDTSNPSKAAIYKLWGYWLQWDELLASVLIPFILFYAAKAITAGPTPQALLEEMDMQKPVKRKKYD